MKKLKLSLMLIFVSIFFFPAYGGSEQLVSKYTITYDANGALGTVPIDNVEYRSGDTVTVLGNTGNLALAGYIFADWNSKPDGSGTAYSIGTSIKIASADITLYAQWLDKNKVLFTKIGTGSVTEYSISPNGKATGNLVIPSRYNGYPVTSIRYGAFGGCSELKRITIPSSVTSIGDWAFNECSGLTSITIPNSVTSIGEYAFKDCSGLTSITISNSVSSIGRSTFSGCSKLTSIKIPDKVTSIGCDAFFYCSGLTSITIPNSVTSIGNHAFFECSGLKSVKIPNSVTSIGRSAFSYCSGLKSITIPSSVTSIEDCTFSYCSGLKSITIPSSVTSIKYAAFSNCRKLTGITLKSATPPGIYPDAFCLIGYGAVFHVPSGTVDAYTEAGYGKYGMIVAP
ncbi:MAG TPA: leucine-rich repeat protein [Spirochaetota bacterium]|nr:leucine-rich repeat protein [Spirochaetota bacterium]HQE59355.1 leucine-rich repeat protein [Spirochaetota bacterium]